jgi:hypothetical protein
MIVPIQQRHHLGGIGIERHSSRVGRLPGARELRLYIRWRKLKHLDGDFAKLMTQRLEPGAERPCWRNENVLFIETDGDGIEP